MREFNCANSNWNGSMREIRRKRIDIVESPGFQLYYDYLIEINYTNGCSISLSFSIFCIFLLKTINIWNFKLNRSMLFQCDQHNLPESIQFRKINTNYVARAGVDRVHMYEKWTIWFKIMDSIPLSCHFNSKAHNNHAHQIVRLNFNIGEVLAILQQRW